MKVAVTTSQERNDLINKAQTIALDLQIPYIKRNKQSLANLQKSLEIDYFMVVEQDGIVLKNGSLKFFWHPNMAVPRLKALRQGKEDRLVETMKLKPGYNVLDCTLGFGADALVCAYAVKESGSVTGLESNKFIAYLTSKGIVEYDGHLKHLKQLTTRIKVYNIYYQDFLFQQVDNSFEVVYFDPMFNHGIQASSGMNALRVFANHQPLEINFLKEALRVCKYRVVMKETAWGQMLNSLSPDYIVKNYGPIAYGVWEK